MGSSAAETSVNSNPKIASVVGCGTIGAGWAARLVLGGWRVQAFDLSDTAESLLQQTLAQAKSAHGKLSSASAAKKSVTGELVVCGDQVASVQNAAIVIENLPEDLQLKQALYHNIEPHMLAEALLVSSTSGFKPSVLAAQLAKPERFLVCHPFNPVYLVPLVEVVAHPSCLADTRQRCMNWLAELGMRPLLVRTEIDGHIADRLLEAMWREALWLVHDNVATTEEIDTVVKHGFGLRMAHMGLFETYRLGGGEGGFEAFLAQFGPALQWPWTHLTNVPDLDAALIRKIVDQSDAQTGNVPHAQRVQERDDNLVAVLNALSN